MSLSTVSGLLQTDLTEFLLCPIAFHSTYLLSHLAAQEKRVIWSGVGGMWKWLSVQILNVPSSLGCLEIDQGGL